MKLSNIDQIAVAQEFHISVTPLGEDEYLVRIERVAPGVPLAEEQVKWSVEDWLAQARQLMNDPLLGVLQGNTAFASDVLFRSEWDEPVSQSSLNLVALGQQLYDALFQGSLRDSWMMAQAIAQNQRSILRLRLGLKGKRLPRLPWEVLYAGDRPLATGTDVVFSRYQLSTGLSNPVQALPSQPRQPLKILMVIASPSDQESLELAQEASQLQDELRRRSSGGLPAIQLTILEQPGREQLTQALEQGQYQVFHYAGHSNLGDSGGDVYLVSNKTGLTEALNGADLAGLLVNNGIQFAVFNSCRGAYTSSAAEARTHGKERNLAEVLVARGIPSVLAMAERIPDEVALTLTRLLYRNLNQGYPIDLSLSRARQGLISAYGSNQLYWALPVLYLHPEFDGFLTKPDDASQTISELLAIADPPEAALLPDQEAVLFTPPARRTSPNFSETEDELDRLAPDELIGEEDFADLDQNDLDADDPGAFIQDLLRQLDPKPLPSRPGSALGFETPSQDTAAADLELPKHPTSNPPATSIESDAITPTPEAAQVSVQPETPSRKSTRFGIWWQKLQHFPKLWMIFGTMGAVAIALLGFWFFQNRMTPRELSQSPPNVPSVPLAQTGSLKQADTEKVTAIAIEQLSQGNIAAGQQAVEALLDRGALQAVEASLAVVPNQKLEDPTVSFLRGRLVWMSIQAGNQDYDVSDARRYWETAQKAQPKSSTYLNALGFAYYAEGNFDRAINAWFDALYLADKAKTGAAKDKAHKEVLSTYAGLALGLRQSAQKQSADKRASLLKESFKYREYVLSQDPVNFQPDALSKNWLWSEKAIQDWRSLLAQGN